MNNLISVRNDSIRYFSMFSGIGGFECGIQAAIPNAKCIGFSEVDKYAISIYKKHFKEHKNYGDATTIDPRELPEFDVLVGGFPCQAFSLAGKRQGFSDTRGTLFFEIARIIKEKSPRLLVLENVKGLLSHDNGNSFNTILAALDELGYDTQWQVCNSKNHGVAQNRERVFIVGYSRTGGTSQRKVFSFQHCNRKTIESQNNKKHLSVVCYNAERGTRDKDLNKKDGGSGMLYREDQLSYVITTKGGHLIQIIGGNEANRVYDPQGLSKTIKNGGGQGVKTGLYLIDNRIRRLMPIECERLQGFADNWTKFGADGESISDAQRYKCIGNAVTVNVISDIFKQLNKNYKINLV